MRDCFCPYIDGPEMCGKSYVLPNRRGFGCRVPYSGGGRTDCPIIRVRGEPKGRCR